MTAKPCTWVSGADPLMIEYHGREWGVPVHEDRKHQCRRTLKTPRLLGFRSNRRQPRAQGVRSGVHLPPKRNLSYELLSKSGAVNGRFRHFGLACDEPMILPQSIWASSIVYVRC